MENLEKEKSKLKEIDRKVDNIIVKKKKNIKCESENIRNLEKVKIKNSFFLNLVNNFDENNMSNYPDESHAILDQLHAYTATATTFNVVEQSILENESNIKDDENIIALVDTTGSFTYNLIDREINLKPSLLPNYISFKLSLNKGEEIQKNIEYIQSELGKLNPDILADFNYFIQTYYSTIEITPKYQCLIGARSMIFIKFIYSFTDTNYPGQVKNFDKIQKFVYGSNIYNSSTRGTINNCKNLYNKLSSPKSPSAKIGGLNYQEIDILFEEILTNFSNILRLRNTYFRP